jgi:hypothetical protein
MLATETWNYYALLRTKKQQIAISILLLITALSFSAEKVYGQCPNPNTNPYFSPRPTLTGCTAGDFQVLGAELVGTSTTCNACIAGETATYTLKLRIENGSASDRAFAFWADMETTSGGVSQICAISGCNPVIPGKANLLIDFGTIRYKCGDVLVLSNILAAWTPASGSCASALSPIQLGKYFAQKKGVERAKFDF